MKERAHISATTLSSVFCIIRGCYWYFVNAPETELVLIVNLKYHGRGISNKTGLPAGVYGHFIDW